MSALAIVTSILGVGVGLCDSLKPAYIVAVVVPNAFITILGFAGMILVIIAILLPVYLLYKTISNYYMRNCRNACNGL
ncbi:MULTISPECIES: aromatic amino acid transport family protein [spotted fever group]|uniref:aromatic amino acid transport family protein n=1 Tax=spotted fever group TaxID=114277 RepID=UPI0009DAB2F6|nr:MULTISPECIES: aromatic amino acid transport family protein [spotted fever group]